MRKSQQLHFYLNFDEVLKVEEYLLSENLILLNYYNNEASPKVAEKINKNEILLYITPSELINKIVFNKVNEFMYCVNFGVSPVIELAIPIVRDHGLTRGRLYANFGYEGRDSWVSYPDILMFAYRRIFKHIKSSYLTTQTYLGGYISKSAQEYLKNGGKLTQF